MTLLTAFWLTVTAGPTLWQEPTRVQDIDFSRLAAQAPEPVPPFRFLREELGGTSAKILVEDAKGVTWQVKGGPEARAEAFVTRLVSALGYFAEPVAFVAEGKVEGLSTPLKRARGFVQPDGKFTYAGFERRDPRFKFLPGESWTWIGTPLRETSELKGLKILIMLVSNWDNKDARNARLGSNTGVLEAAEPKPHRIHFVTDWGQSLGRWGRFFFGRTNWDCEGFTAQTPSWVTKQRDGRLRFRYVGQHTSDFYRDIGPSDAQWLLKYLGVINDAQLLAGLRASGATDQERQCFTLALRDRIEQLRRVAE